MILLMLDQIDSGNRTAIRILEERLKTSDEIEEYDKSLSQFSNLIFFVRRGLEPKVEIFIECRNY